MPCHRMRNEEYVEWMRLALLLREKKKKKKEEDEMKQRPVPVVQPPVPPAETLWFDCSLSWNMW